MEDSQKEPHFVKVQTSKALCRSCDVFDLAIEDQPTETLHEVPGSVAKNSLIDDAPHEMHKLAIKDLPGKELLEVDNSVSKGRPGESYGPVTEDPLIETLLHVHNFMTKNQLSKGYGSVNKYPPIEKLFEVHNFVTENRPSKLYDSVSKYPPTETLFEVDKSVTKSRPSEVYSSVTKNTLTETLSDVHDFTIKNRLSEVCESVTKNPSSGTLGEIRKLVTRNQPSEASLEVSESGSTAKSASSKKRNRRNRNRKMRGGILGKAQNEPQPHRPLKNLRYFEASPQLPQSSCSDNRHATVAEHGSQKSSVNVGKQNVPQISLIRLEGSEDILSSNLPFDNRSHVMAKLEVYFFVSRRQIVYLKSFFEKCFV